MTSLKERMVAVALDQTIQKMMNDVIDKAVERFTDTDPKYCYMQGMVMALYSATANPDAERLLKRWFESFATDDQMAVMTMASDQLAESLADAEKYRAKALKDILKALDDA